MENIQNITLDIMNNKENDYIYTKQDDVGRQIIFSFTDNGVPVSLSNVTGAFMLKQPNNTVLTDTLTVSDNKMALTLSALMTEYAGKLPYQISLRDGNSKSISSVTSYMICDESVARMSVNDASSQPGGESVLIKSVPTKIVLTASGWNNNEQTVSMQGIIADDESQFVNITPVTSNAEEYLTSNITCVSQSTNSLTFKCLQQTPLNDLTVFVTYQNI